VFHSQEQLLTQVFCVPEATLTRAEMNEFMQLGETQIPSLDCQGLTSGSLQSIETMLVFSSAPKLGNQTLPTALNLPFSSLRFTD